MRQIRLMAVLAIPLMSAVLVLVTTTEASATTTTPGPPTSVHAVAIAGVRGTTVSWGAPVSNGGSPILYYVASNYTGSHSCTSFTPGPGSCHIDGLEIGAVKPSIRVRAVNARGRGALAVTLPVVTHLDGGTTSPSAPSGSSQAGGSQTTPASASAAASGTTSATGTSASSSGGDPPALPLTGVDVKALFIVGLALVLAGALILRVPGRRRRMPVGTADWLLQK